MIRGLVEVDEDFRAPERFAKRIFLARSCGFQELVVDSVDLLEVPLEG